MEIDLDLVDTTSLPALTALAQLYQYDFSEIEGGVIGLDGRFRYLDDLEERLAHPGATAWLFRVVDPQFLVETLAGFAIVLPITDGSADQAIDEFFVLRKYRRLGVGRAAATAIMGAVPGAWVVQGTRNNTVAKLFWRRIVDAVAVGTAAVAEDPSVIYPAWGFRFHVG
jgi:predicted acetyltransferase